MKYGIVLDECLKKPHTLTNPILNFVCTQDKSCDDAIFVELIMQVMVATNKIRIHKIMNKRKNTTFNKWVYRKIVDDVTTHNCYRIRLNFRDIINIHGETMRNYLKFRALIM